MAIPLLLRDEVLAVFFTGLLIANVPLLLRIRLVMFCILSAYLNVELSCSLV